MQGKDTNKSGQEICQFFFRKIDAFSMFVKKEIFCLFTRGEMILFIKDIL